MADEGITTVSWTDAEGHRVEADWPIWVVEAIARGETATWQGGEEPRRYGHCPNCGELTLLGDKHVCAAK
jgi:hypothetical protein